MAGWKGLRVWGLVLLAMHSSLASVNDAQRVAHDGNITSLPPPDVIATTTTLVRAVLEHTGADPAEQAAAARVLVPLLCAVLRVGVGEGQGEGEGWERLLVQVGSAVHTEHARPALRRVGSLIALLSSRITAAMDQHTLSAVGEKLLATTNPNPYPNHDHPNPPHNAKQATPPGRREGGGGGAGERSVGNKKGWSAVASALQPGVLVQQAADDQEAMACAVGALAFGEGCVITCSAGHFASVCSPGGVDQYYMPLPPTAECAECPAGKFDHQPSQTCDGCKSCPPGTFSPPASTSCTPCPPGSFSSSSSSPSCSPCPVGTAAPSPNATSCAACPATHWAAEGSTECSACSGGCVSGVVVEGCWEGGDVVCGCGKGTVGEARFGPGVANACTACSDNTYQDQPGMATCNACDECPAGQTLHTPCSPSRNTQCQCDVGYAGVAGGFEAGTQTCGACSDNTYQDSSGQAECKACPAHSERGGGMSATHCACLPGYAGPGTHDGGCTECAIGTFKASTAAHEACTACGPALTTLAPAAASNDACVCDVGHYPSDAACVPCRAGTYKDSVGNTACAACPVGSTSMAGATALSFCFCAKGYHGSAGVCSPCDVGHYQDETNQPHCKACPTGSTTEETGAASRDQCQCDAGFSGAVTAATNSCAPCAEGKFKTTIGSDACSSCPGNRQSSSATSEKCECRPGYTTDDCVACEGGTFKPSPGSGACSVCPAHSESPAGSAVVTACKCDEGWSGVISSPSSSCSQCSAGSTFQSVRGQPSCLPCSPCPAASSLAVEPCTASRDTLCQCVAGYTRADAAVGAFVFAATTCEPCPNNHHSESGQACEACGTCPVGSIAIAPCGAHNTECVCQAGYASAVASFFADDTSPCTPCAPGTAKTHTGRGECERCPAGTYGDSPGLRECKPCPTHSTHAVVGAHDVTTCVCSEGLVMDVADGMASCGTAPSSPPSPLSSGAIAGLVLASLPVVAAITLGVYKLLQWSTGVGFQYKPGQGHGDGHKGDAKEGVQGGSRSRSSSTTRSAVGPLG